MAAHGELARLIAESRKILVFTGAGISTGSGIPDYRGPTGVWKTKQPVLYQDFMSSEAARIEYWQQKSEGWEQLRDAEPNGVHRAIVALEKVEKLLLCVTQNIDGLHEKAGTSRALLVELHGTGRAVECQSCGERSDPEAHFASFRADGKAPCCRCGGFLKPATISFGQQLRATDLREAALAAREADLVVALGSTLSVYPAADIPLAAAERGTPYVIVNRGRTEHDGLSAVRLRLEGDVGEIFPSAVANALGA